MLCVLCNVSDDEQIACKRTDDEDHRSYSMDDDGVTGSA